MSKMKVNEFIDKAIEYEKIPSLYGWGKFMNSKQGQLLLCDCSGLIKGILWGYPYGGKYCANDVPDNNADTMISKCSNISTNFKTIKIGALVWMKGHIGIYVGNGVCVESSPAWENGIQCTFVRGSGYSNTRKLKERTWVKWGLFDKYVDYSESSKPTPPSENAETYTLIKTVDVYMNASNANNRKDAVTKYSSGTYYIFSKNSGMINITKKKGSAGGWINPSDNVSSTNTSYYAKYTGKSSSLVDALKSLKIDSSYSFRVKIAKANGLTLTTSNSASVNSSMLNLLKQGKLKKA